MPFKKTIFFPLYVEYVGEIFNPHPHIPHMHIIRIIRIFRIRMANPNPDRLEHVDYLGQFDHLNHQDYQITTTMKLILIQSYSDHLHHQHYLIAETSMHTTFDAATYWPAGHFVTNVIYFSQFNNQ